MSTRPARADDVDEICRSLPETWFGTSWGDVPTWLVPLKASSGARGDKGRGFVLYRRPHKSAIDPDTGELYDDLLVIRTANAEDKQALVDDDGPFFTIDHFKGSNAVLVQQSRLGEISHDELVEVITEAWLGDGAGVVGEVVPGMKVDPARLAAYDVLVAVRELDAYANLVLPALLRERDISGRDAAFATELVGGTLRGLGAYDVIVDHLAARPPDPSVRDALRLGAHQVLAMRVPDHAAVASTVELVRHRVGHKPAGYTNALMRRLAARDLDGWMDALDAPLSVRTSHPAWVVDALADALGRPDELEALLAADNDRPRVTLVARPGLSTVDELGRVFETLAGARSSTTRSISPLGVVLESGDPGEVPAVREGRAGVQDAGSQLVALALTRAAVRGRDVRWLDLCAGPGGKAALLAALGADRGVRLVANEALPHRARLVRQALRVITGDVVVADGTRPAWPPDTFDRVLVDAPCTGLGALRRRPESRWRRQPSDLEALVPLQRSLLAAALDSVRPGGVVVYATCSPVVEETAGVVRAVLTERDDVRLEDAKPLVPEAVDAASAHLDGAVQLWPHRHGTDAMFLALLRRANV